MHVMVNARLYKLRRKLDKTSVRRLIQLSANTVKSGRSDGDPVQDIADREFLHIILPTLPFETWHALPINSRQRIVKRCTAHLAGLLCGYSAGAMIELFSTEDSLR